MSQELLSRLPRGASAPSAERKSDLSAWRNAPSLSASRCRERGVFASLLNGALRAFVQDAVLDVLEVHSVEPEFDGLCLRVVLQPRRGGVFFDQSAALARARACGPRLRAALAAALDREVAPELLFEVRSWIEA